MIQFILVTTSFLRHTQVDLFLQRPRKKLFVESCGFRFHMSLRRGSHRSSPLHSNSTASSGGSGIIATAVDDPDHSNSSMDAAQDVALVGSPQHHHHTDMSSSDSPYLNAATFEPTVDEVKTLKKSQQRWNAIVFTVGMAAFFTAFTAMATIRTFFVGICFIWPLVLGPYMIRQRRFILKFPILRRLINRVRFQANRLQVSSVYYTV